MQRDAHPFDILQMVLILVWSQSAQNWDMFSPTVKSDDGWIVLSGVLRDGTPVDLTPVLFEDHGAASNLRNQCVQKYLKHASNATHDNGPGWNGTGSAGFKAVGRDDLLVLARPRYHGQETPSVHWIHLFAVMERVEGCNETCLQLGKFVCRRFNSDANIQTPSQVRRSFIDC
eukprot:m.656427 g.656427  ORF g.656427 m.656427 type:complete len:173 (+) comp22702_c0_seq21:502-1020(+)